jgi:hypothetical protein
MSREKKVKHHAEKGVGTVKPAAAAAAGDV